MIRDLKIEYQNHPLGIDTAPRFSWKLVSEQPDTVQKCYHIQVISNGKMVWDSGSVESEASVLIPYRGEPLTPSTAYQVQVCAMDNHGSIGQLSGQFETGLMTEENFRAAWITHAIPDGETFCPVFTKQFSAEKELRSARLYATALGVYAAQLNGHRIGNDYMAPGWTSYHRRLQYQTYDITDLMKEGANDLAVTVGNGWFKGELGFDAKPNNYGDRTALRAMIRLEYADGRTEVIGTDDSWSVESGSIRSSEIYYGETQDLTWKSSRLHDAVLLEDLSAIGAVVAQESEPVTVTKRFSPIAKIVTPKGELVYDFGQNMAGIVEVTLPKLTGEKLVIRHAETLDKDGNFYTDNLRTAISVDTYLYDETHVGQIAAPHFTFHGFRYIAVEGVSEETPSECFTACALHTDMTQNGSFRSDNALVNQLQSNIEWGQRSNFFDVPTDCPQRNERLGWTGDAQVFCGTAAYNFDTALFFRKWLRDMAAETTLEWGVPHVVPNILGDQDGAAAWSDAATIIPWTMYQIYGDKEALREQFPMMKMWVDYIRSKTSENGLWQNGFQYGDWLALDIESGSTDRTGGTDKYLVANAYYAESAKLVSDAAFVLGETEIGEEYRALHEEIVEAINREFVTATGRLVSETQTAATLMLHFHLAKPEFRERILNTLETNINAHHGHLTTGFVGTPYLCHTLSENGKHELADEIFMKEDFPGWFYAVKKGATTIWERWNSVLPNGDFDESGMNSLNHYAYGSIGSWLYERVAGIRPLQAGYKQILIQPNLTKGMTEVSASYESVYGTIKSAWVCRDGKIQIDVEIPANTTAVIVLPEREERITVGSGSYHYEYDTDTRLESERYTFESTLGELADTELGRQLLNEAEPGMLENPMIKFAFPMTITELLAMAPETKPLYQAVIDALNKAEQQTV